MTDIVSSFGTQIQILATYSFPLGFTITEYSDDSDGIDFPSIDIAGSGMTPNGVLVVWSKPSPLQCTITTVAEGPDDENLQILFENNRVGRGKQSVQDIITAVFSYPSGKVVKYLNGIISNGMPGYGFNNEGKIKTMNYGFVFENKIQS